MKPQTLTRCALFETQVHAENDHNIAGFEAVLAPDTPDFTENVVLVSRAGRFVGRNAVVARFSDYFKGAWKLAPNWEQILIVRLGRDACHLIAPTQITLGAPDKEPVTLSFLINEIATRTSQGWRFTTIIPVLLQ